MPRGLSPAAPSLSLHLFPFSSPLRRILVWYRLSLVYKYPRIWPCQGRATAAHLSSFFPFVCPRGQLRSILSLFLTLLVCLVTLDRLGQAWPSPSLKTHSIVCSWILWNMTLVLVLFHIFVHPSLFRLTCGLYVCVTEGMGR